MNQSEIQCRHAERYLMEREEQCLSEYSLSNLSKLEQHVSGCEGCQQLRGQEIALTRLLLGGSHSRYVPPSPVLSNGATAKLAWVTVAAVVGLVFAAYSFSSFRLGGPSTTTSAGWQVNDHKMTRTVFGSINTRPVISNASHLISSSSLQSANHIELPAAAAATIELNDTGTISAVGPVVLEIDRVNGDWKVTLITGQAKISVNHNRIIHVAGESGVSELTAGTWQIKSGGDSFVRRLQDDGSPNPSVQQEEDDSGLTASQMHDLAMTVFQSDPSDKIDMKRSASLLAKVIEHPKATSTEKLSAAFYLPAAFANSEQYASALEAGNSFLEKYPGFNNDVILAIVGESNWKLGNTEDARRAWKKLIEMNPDSPFRPGIESRLDDPTMKHSPRPKRNAVATDKTESTLENISKPEVMWSQELDAPSFGAASVADVDNDGQLEIGFGTYFGDDSVRVLNGEDGSELWRYNAGSACLDASLRFYDLDADGDVELLVPVSNKGQLIAFQADSGKEVWSYQPSPTECTDSPSTILDLDGDGQPECVYGTFLGNLHVVDATTGKAKRVYHVSDEFIQTAPTVLDLNHDGTMDFVCATFKGKNNIYDIDGDTGERLWQFHVPGEHMGMYHGCSTGDLDNDGRMELVTGAFDGKIYCLDAEDGSLRWTATAGDSFIMSPTVIADIDGDGDLEVISASQRVFVLDHTGKIIWEKSCSFNNGVDSATRGASIADLNGDGQLDIATLTGSGEFQVFDGARGETLFQFSCGDICDFTPFQSSHGVTIADLDDDGYLDTFLVVGTTMENSNRGMAICLTGFKGSGRGWYMLRHDTRNSGNLETAIEPSLLQHIEHVRN